MKIKYSIPIFGAVLGVLLLAGCVTVIPSRQLPAASDPSVSRPARSEEQAEPSAPVTGQPAEPQKQPAPSTAGRISAEQAKDIALAHAGFAAGQVSRLQAEPELDKQPPHYDVEFHQGQWEYDYAIHAETGAILSFEKDD